MKPARGTELPVLDKVHRRRGWDVIAQVGPARVVHGDYRLDSVVLSPPAGCGWCWTGSCTPWATRWPPWSRPRSGPHHGQSTTTLKEPTSMRTSEAPVHAAIATMTTMRMAAIQIHV